ncbi:unnamed protein product [Fraxinus pennsylvanica]|uniref:RRM domain-containing protein n=1 Tax=Fraxinus pennsylvanica TaxID=56036 RepID=A0AAD2E2V8_9LAMI|nr:unnamed protein product [Fraxinus pennsylvanica]
MADPFSSDQATSGPETYEGWFGTCWMINDNIAAPSVSITLGDEDNDTDCSLKEPQVTCKNTNQGKSEQVKSLKTQTLTSALHSTAAPTEDVDSRTIFVSNVYFAATKNSLSRHFNNFEEVQKVIIPTDATTGQSKGSAYIEFTRREAAMDSQLRALGCMHDAAHG